VAQKTIKIRYCLKGKNVRILRCENCCEAPKFTAQSWGAFSAVLATYSTWRLWLLPRRDRDLEEFILDLFQSQSSAGGVLRPCHIGAMKNRPFTPLSSPERQGMAVHKADYVLQSGNRGRGRSQVAMRRANHRLIVSAIGLAIKVLAMG
jgi:hypothetical protein